MLVTGLCKCVNEGFGSRKGLLAGLCGVTGAFPASISFSKAIVIFGTLFVYC